MILPADLLGINVLRGSAVHDNQVLTSSGGIAESVLGRLEAPAEGRLPIDPLARAQ